jgi:hypothetical protein
MHESGAFKGPALHQWAVKFGMTDEDFAAMFPPEPPEPEPVPPSPEPVPTTNGHDNNAELQALLAEGWRRFQAEQSEKPRRRRFGPFNLPW